MQGIPLEIQREREFNIFSFNFLAIKNVEEMY